MKTPGFKQIRTILLHILFWIAVWFFFIYFFSYNSDDKSYVTWFSSLLLPLTMVVTYFAVYFLIPRFLLEKKYWKFALFSFYTLVFSSYMIVLIIYGCLIVLLKFDATTIPPMVKNFLFILILVYLVVGIVSTVTILNHNFRTDRENKDLQNKILATQLQIKEQELHYLKMQLHPHFLFNTLNTIYGFALKQSKQTPEIILKLSNLLDYILYQIDKPRVSLKEEVLHIKEYIELEEVRFQETLKISFSSNEFDDTIEIAPMLLMPFVENAFKHGSLRDGFLLIEMDLNTQNNTLCFTIRNSVPDQEQKNGGQGIGLENIRKRLDLNYQDNYKLEKEVSAGWYAVKLTILNTNSMKDV